MKRASFALLALVTACNVRCGGATPIVIPPAPPRVAVDASDVCAAACGAAASCGCPFAAGMAEQQCEIACRRDQAQGNAAQLAPACLAEAGTCGALKSCGGVTGCP